MLLSKVMCQQVETHLVCGEVCVYNVCHVILVFQHIVKIRYHCLRIIEWIKELHL